MDTRREFRSGGRMAMEASCSQCGTRFVRLNVQKKILLRPFLFCNQECQKTAQKTGGVLDLKKKEIFQDRYGVSNPSQAKEIKEKREATFVERFGGNPSKDLAIKEKKTQASIKNYGVRHPQQSGDVRQKTEKTCLQRYGTKSYLGTAKSQEDRKVWAQAVHGVDNYSQSEECKEKFTKTMRGTYGVDNPLKNPVVVQKVRDTCLERYGVDNLFKTEKAKKNLRKSFEARLLQASSEPENRFYEDLVEFFGEGRVQRQVQVWHWWIDFWVLDLDLYIQFDGEFWHGKTKTQEELKALVLEHDKNSIWSAILANTHKDRRQDAWFQNRWMCLQRVTDIGYLALKKQGILGSWFQETMTKAQLTKDWRTSG